MKLMIRVFIWTSLFYYMFIARTLLVISYQKVDPELVPYVAEYKNLLDKYCETKQYNTSNFYSIKLLPKMEADHIGVCYRKFNGYKIEINGEWWNTASEDDRKQLIFHELAHCLIDKDHVEDQTNYMNPFFVSLKYQDLYDQVTLDIYNRCH